MYIAWLRVGPEYFCPTNSFMLDGASVLGRERPVLPSNFCVWLRVCVRMCTCTGVDLSKILGGQNKILGGKEVKLINAWLLLLGGTCPGYPPKVYAYVRLYVGVCACMCACMCAHGCMYTLRVL